MRFLRRFQQLEGLLLPAGRLVEGVPIRAPGGAAGVRHRHVHPLRAGQGEGEGA